MKVVLFPEIGLVKIFLSFTHPHSRNCVRIYAFIFKKQKSKKNKTTKKAIETKEKQRKYLRKID